MKQEIKIFEDRNKDIQEDDLFIAKIGYVEGRKVVTLKKYGNHNEDYEGGL